MAITIPHINYRSPVVDSSGMLTEVWAKWFRQMFERIGGNIALTNLELENLQTQDISALQTTVTALQTTTVSLQSQITQNNSDLNQGPVL